MKTNGGEKDYIVFQFVTRPSFSAWIVVKADISQFQAQRFRDGLLADLVPSQEIMICKRVS